MRDIYTTMSATFPEIETWQTDSGDLILVAFDRQVGLCGGVVVIGDLVEPLDLPDRARGFGGIE